MRRSVERVLTTHAGSLPRPEELRTAWSRPMNDQQQEAELQALLQNSVVNVVAEQAKIAIDVPNDGEFGKPMRTASDLAAWGTYIFNRLSGFGPTPAGAEAPDKAASGQSMRIVGLRWEQREFPYSMKSMSWAFHVPLRGRLALAPSHITAIRRCTATSPISRALPMRRA